MYKNHMMISINAKKAFYKIYHSFIIKILNNLSVEEMYFKILKAMYDKSIS